MENISEIKFPQIEGLTSFGKNKKVGLLDIFVLKV